MVLVLLLCWLSAPLQVLAKEAVVTAAGAECAPRITTVKAVAQAQAGELTIATQNLQRLFDDESGGRGDVVAAAEYRQKLERLAGQVTEVLRLPDVLAVQEAENIKVLRDLAAVIADRNGRPAYRALLLEGHDYGGIDSGFLLRADIDVLLSEQLLKARRLDRAPLFDRPPLRLQIRRKNGETLDIINVHLKSLRGSDDPDVGKKTARKRLRQAEALAEWLGAWLGKYPQAKLVLLGDFNATPDSLGGVDVLGLLQATGMKDVDETLPEQERYSYVHECRGEALDHLLLSPALLPALSRVAVSRGNAGVSGRREPQDRSGLRSSDHDGLVLYLRP